MPWFELNSADDPKLNELATKYQLHPLHVEDARATDERIKVNQPHPVCPWHRSCRRRRSSDGCFQADPRTGLRGSTLRRQHGTSDHAKRQEKDHWHASRLLPPFTNAVF
jgi:hypothetical protein